MAPFLDMGGRGGSFDQSPRPSVSLSALRREPIEAGDGTMATVTEWMRLGEAWMTPASIATLALAAAAVSDAAAQQGPPIAGIHHFEVVLLGLDHEDHPSNAAYAISNGGIVVGRVNDAGATRAFVYMLRDRTSEFGAGAGSFRLLSPADAVGAVAYAVNDAGVIVGSVGAGSDADFDEVRFVERAASWRLSTAGGDSFDLAMPPSSTDFLPYTTGGYGRFRAVSEGLTPWATGAFRLASNCGSSQFSPRRTAATALWLRATAPSAADYRWEIPSAARSEARAISPLALQSGGVQYNCPSWDEPRARGWFIGGANELLGFSRHFAPSPASGSLGTTTIDAVADDGCAVGFGLVQPNSEPELALFWRPGAGSLGAMLPPASVDGHGLKGARARGLAATSGLACGLEPGRLAVGRFRPTSGERGRFWFRPDTAGSDWTTGSWSYHDPLDFISPIARSRIIVKELFGVNASGDMVGRACIGCDEALGIAGRTVPIVLRSVTDACVGDLNHDGAIGAPDLAVVLGSWCLDGGIECNAAADLDIDGVVGAADLAIILTKFGSTCGCSSGSGLEVPAQVASEAKDSIEFSIQYVGLEDIPTYQQWAAVVPPELRLLVDQAIWGIASEGGIE
jgi:hypothetical protein